MVIVLEVLAVVVPAAMVLLADHVPYTWSIPTALAACALLPVRRWRPWVAALACLPGLVGGLGLPPTVVALYRIGRKSTVPVMITWVALATVLPSTVVVVSQGLAPGAALLTFAFSLFVAGAPTALGALITTRRELTASLAEASRARIAEVEAREDGARAAERARIAREIHDAVGHHATLIAVESAALAATTEDVKTRDTALRLRALAKEALAEMRAALGLLNTEPSPGFDGLSSPHRPGACSRPDGRLRRPKRTSPTTSHGPRGLPRGARSADQRDQTRPRRLRPRATVATGRSPTRDRDQRPPLDPAGTVRPGRPRPARPEGAGDPGGRHLDHHGPRRRRLRDRRDPTDGCVES